MNGLGRVQVGFRVSGYTKFVFRLQGWPDRHCRRSPLSSQPGKWGESGLEARNGTETDYFILKGRHHVELGITVFVGRDCGCGFRPHQRGSRGSRNRKAPIVPFPVAICYHIRHGPDTFGSLEYGPRVRNQWRRGGEEADARMAEQGPHIPALKVDCSRR